MLTFDAHLPLSLQEPLPSGAVASEQIVGELVALTATLLAQGLGQLKQAGRLGADTKAYGGRLVAALIELREGTVGFDQMAKVQGVKALRARCDNAVNDATINTLVESVLVILHGVIKFRLN
jgi:hypothetical protein